MRQDVKITKHAYERIMERYGVCENNAKMILKQAYRDAKEVRINGDGRAFKSFKESLIMVVSNSLEVMITTYNSSGKEVLLSDDELIEAARSDSGIYEDSKRMEIFYVFKRKNL